MESICPKEDCTGCMACLNICAHQAIDICTDEEGFERPQIDSSKCVDCDLCRIVCPANNKPTSSKPIAVYSGWSKDESTRIASSSGGAFSSIAHCILEKGGVVFGAALNEELKAEHISIEKECDLKKLQGSKYVQSSIHTTYRNVKEHLKKGEEVLFSGTPCQVAGLRNYLRKSYPNLTTIDLICHGVPSPLIFDGYKDYIRRTEKITIEDIKFRGKKSSWIFFNISIDGYVEKGGKKKTYIGNYYDDPYIRGFLRDYFLRPSCHKCQFCSTARCSDFTIGDWWNYRPAEGEKNDYEKKGVSLIMCNTDKAAGLFNEIRSHMTVRPRTLEEALKTNISLQHPFELPKSRSIFWQDYHKMNFDALIKKYMHKERLLPSRYIRYKCGNTLTRNVSIKIIGKLERVLSKIGAGRLIPRF